MPNSPKPWARVREHGPCMIFDWHETEYAAREAIEQSIIKNGSIAGKIQTVAYFPDRNIRIPAMPNSPMKCSACGCYLQRVIGEPLMEHPTLDEELHCSFECTLDGLSVELRVLADEDTKDVE